MADKIILALTELGPSLSFRGANDAVVFACLALLRDSGFRFVEGAGEGQFPSNWQSSADVYAFRMKHSRSALNFLIKFVPMEDVMLVHAMTAEDKRIHTLELKTGLYARNAAADEAFTDKINELASQLRASIISKIFPEAGKEGYEADSSSSNQAPRPREPDRAQEQRQPEHPRFDPLMDPTFQPRYPPMRPLPVGCALFVAMLLASAVHNAFAGLEALVAMTFSLEESAVLDLGLAWGAAPWSGPTIPCSALHATRTLATPAGDLRALSDFLGVPCRLVPASILSALPRCLEAPLSVEASQGPTTTSCPHQIPIGCNLATCRPLHANVNVAEESPLANVSKA